MNCLIKVDLPLRTGPHHTDVDIPAGACADLATDAVLFLFLQGPSPLPVALRTAPVGVGVLVVSYEKGAFIMPGQFLNALRFALGIISGKIILYNCN